MFRPEGLLQQYTKKSKPNSLFIYGQITSDDIMTVQRVRTMMVREYKG